jgi:hypothetical protein
VLPIVTRGCICDLSNKIGLGAESTAAKFKLTNQIQTFRHVQTDLVRMTPEGAEASSLKKIETYLYVGKYKRSLTS